MNRTDLNNCIEKVANESSHTLEMSKFNLDSLVVEIQDALWDLLVNNAEPTGVEKSITGEKRYWKAGDGEFISIGLDYFIANDVEGKHRRLLPVLHDHELLNALELGEQFNPESENCTITRIK